MTDGPASCLVVLPRPALSEAAVQSFLRHLPVLDVLAASGRRVLVLAAPESAPLLVHALGEPEPLPRLPPRGEQGGETRPGLAQTRALVHAAGPAEAVLLAPRLDDAWLLRSARIPRRWGYRSLLTGWCLNHRVAPPSRGTTATRPASADDRELLVAMGVLDGELPPPRLAISDAHRNEARERLRRAHIRDGEGPLVGVYPGVLGDSGLRPWPRQYFDEVVRRARQQRPSARFVVLATTEDLWRAVRLHEETGKIHPVIGPDLKLDGLAALLAEMDAVVAVDSWMLDLAAAAGTPTLGLFVREPRRFAPVGDAHRVIRASALALVEVEQVVGELVANL